MKRCREIANVRYIRLRFGVRGFVLNIPICNRIAAKPCQIFDLIGGTSTGGYVMIFVRCNRVLTLLSIIAIMLGRLEMDVSDCIRIYKEMFKEVFGNQRHWWPVNLTGRVQA
jgi:hypothetical protein